MLLVWLAYAVAACLSLLCCRFFGLLFLLKHAALFLVDAFPLARARWRGREEDWEARYGRGTWAVVTGASDGIGLAFCHFLAARGFSVLMVARNRAKTEAAAKRVREGGRRGVATRVVVKDFEDALKPGFFDDIEAAMAGLDVSIVVNNVGVPISDESITFSLEYLSLTTIAKGVTINCTAQAALHSIMMKRLSQSHRTAFIDVSSIGSDVYFLPSETYDASKTFNRYFTNSRAGCGTDGVDYLSCVVGPVDTIIVDHVKDVSLKDMNPITTRECVEGLMKSLGVIVDSAGHIKHVVSKSVCRLIDDFRPVLFDFVKPLIRSAFDKKRKARYPDLK